MYKLLSLTGKSVNLAQSGKTIFVPQTTCTPLNEAESLNQ